MSPTSPPPPGARGEGAPGRPGRPEGLAVGARGTLPLPRLAPRVDADRVAGLERDPALDQDVLQLPAVHRRVLRHARHAPVARDVEHDAAGEDALRPVLDRPEPGAVERDLLLRGGPLPH